MKFIMRNLLTIKQLQYLSALNIHRHFGLVAEACHVTQSTLSLGIRDLERVLESELRSVVIGK